MSSTYMTQATGRGELVSALTAMADLYQMTAADPSATTYPTGFTPLDHVLGGGVQAGNVVVVGGKPGVGKTIACLQWARSMVRQGTVVVYVCYEHDPLTLLCRLLACELSDSAVAVGRHRDVVLDELRGRLRDLGTGALTLREVVDSDPLLDQSVRRLTSYADRLVLLQGARSRTDVTAIEEAVASLSGAPVALFVDYVQAVPAIPPVPSESERVSSVVERLKELALDRSIPVVAIAAADQMGLSARRLHLSHFRGSTALAYEADVVLVLNEKLDIVSKAHVAFAANRADEFRRRVVFSVEKNRGGPSGVDLEFTKDFAQFRFDPQGSWVAERLWTEGSVEP